MRPLGRTPRFARLLVAAGLLTALLAGVGGGAARATGTGGTRIVARNPDGNYIVPGVLGGVVYRRTGGASVSLDAYLQRRGEARPAVVVVHGGGWTSGSRIARVGQLLELLTVAGFSWFSIDYRQTPEYRHPDQLDDLRRAIRFVRHHARRFRVDPDRLAAIGESASGQMVAQLAARPCEGRDAAPDPVDREPRSVAAVVSFYGVYDFLPMVQDASPRSLLARLFGRTTLDEEARRLLRRYSPLHQAHRAMPPMLLVHGTDERLWEQGVAFARRLEEAGVDHELLRLDGAPHGMENWEGRPEWSGYKRKLVEWLERKLANGGR